MANDSKIVITAGLQIPETVSTVEKELKVVGEKVSADRALKIVANVDLSKTTQRIQSQLATLSKNLKLDINTVNVNSSGINGVQQNIQQTSTSIDDANKRVQQLNNSLADLKDTYSQPIKAVLDKQGFVKASETMQELKKQLADLGTVSVQGVYSDTNGVNKLEKMVATVKSAYGELRTLTFELGDNDFFRFVSGKFDNDGVRKQTEEITKFVDQYTSKLNSLKAKVGENFAPNISATIGEDINKTIVTFDSFEKKLAELKSGKGSIEELRSEFVALDGTVSNLGSLLRGGDSSLNQFTNATIKARNFANDLKALEVEFENLSAVTKGDKLFSSLADAEQKLVNLQNIQKNEGYTENWIKQYQELSVAIKQATEDVKLAKKLEQQDASSATKKQADALREVASAYKEINQCTKTLYSTSATDVEKGLAGAHRGDQYALIEQIKQRLESEGLLDDVLKQEIQNYEAIAKEIELIAKSRRDATQAHREEVETEKAEKQNLQDVNKLINDNIKSLEKFNNSTVAKNNASNPTVVSQTGLNADLINQLRGLQESLANDKSPENIARITARMNELGSSLRDAKFNSEALDQSLRDESSAAKLNANISKLINQMDVFANTNRKATESLRQMRSGVTFADEWQRITSALKSGNLDDNAIRRLTEDFRNFKGEARSVGVATSSFFNNMGSQLKMLVSRWVSLYAVIGKIRTMIDYVTQLDSAMTKLKRVTDETAAGYERFLETAKESARETNTTLVDTVEQAAKWAKSGYDAATSAELAKTSLIYSIVGDIDNDTAVSDLVTALRGFRLEAEDAISVVDKLDALNNKYATDAKSLGEGLRVSASAMAAANNDIDQTLALLTGATEITQNAQETGHAIKTITMRLRGMKGELQELGEDAEGVESISKIQTQILNLTKGRVNIFDANGNFRATYDILKDISEVYNELSDPDKANLTEIIFGKLRSNQGLAIISAFQSGQIQKALKDSQNAAGTATEEMERYAESIQAHLNQFKEVAQELSADAIDTKFVKDIINDGITLLTLLNDIVKALKEIKDIVPQSLRDAYNYINDNPILNPFREILKLANTGDELYSKLFGANATHIDEVNEMSTGLDSIVQKYIEYNGVGEDSESITAKLSSEIENINEAYSDNSDKIDLVNKGLSENLSLMRQMEKQEIGKWIKDNAEDYQEAIDALNRVAEINPLGNAFTGAGDAFAMNAKGVSRYTKEQYDAFAKLGLNNYISGQNTGYTYDFALTGTLEEQLDSLTKIRDVYASLQDREQDRLDQFDAEIEKIKDQISEYNNLIKTYDQYKTRYESMQNVTAQEYNLIEQAINAYKEYQSAVLSDDRDSATNAYASLNSIKEIVYSMTDTNSVLRQDFNDLWATFVFGATEGMSKIEEVRADFAELSGEAFDNELKNIESISKAIDSMLNDETLSHEDAWKLLNLDTEGVLSDIQLINGQYKLSTDQLVALMEQQINKQKESIETVKAAAQAELDLLHAQMRRLKVNSPSDVAAYKLEVERITDEMQDMQDVISGSDLLLQEVNGILGKTYSITGSIATGLSNAVKQFEAEVEAIDNAIDSLNDRKEVLQDEKSILQDQLDALNEQKKTIEDTLATYDRVGEAVDELVKAQVDGIQAQIDALEEERKSIEDYYEEQLDALKEQNEERDDAIEKEEALANLANAQNQKKRVYSSDRGWDYEASKADILKAQNELAKIANNEQIKMLENERDAKLAGYDDRKKEYETQIKEYEDYASKYTSISNDIKIAENELLAAQVLGSDWREKIEQKDESLLTNYRAQYTSFNEQLNNLTNDEIATLQASIDAKDEEIKKIDDEIAAYNKYKKSVEKSLNDAKTALENYKNSMNDAKAGIISASNEMENSVYNNAVKMQQWMKDTENVTWENHNKIIQWYSEIGDAAEELQKKLRESPTGFGIVNSAWDARLAGYADGGVNTSTGIAMLHGTKQRGEVIFNASDSKKLYDMIHGTPNLLADVVKQANKIAGFSPVNNNNSTNSVSVSIGQIVANNPQEFTRGLDRELDQYFRRKLTESYVQ